MIQVKEYKSLNNMYADYGKLTLNPIEMREQNLKHIVIEGTGDITLTIILDKDGVNNALSGDYINLVEENISEYRGLYGVYGEDVDSQEGLKKMMEMKTGEQHFIGVMNYTGKFYQINSGIMSGKVIIPEDNLSQVKVRNIHL